MLVQENMPWQRAHCHYGEVSTQLRKSIIDAVGDFCS